jgi:hypothetical protein
MRFETGIATVVVMSCAALFLVSLSMLLQWRGRSRSLRELAALRAEMESQKAASTQMLTDLRRGFEGLEETVRTPPEPPRAGGLNRSERAQALQLLRSGMSPESAAAALGMGRREMRLLERVSQTIYLR